jgi:phosphoglycolate phosphatase
MITGILFDKDGTLFDFERSWSGFAHGLLMDLADGEAALAAQMGAQIGYDTGARSFASDSCLIAGTDADVVAALLPMLSGTDAPTLKTRISLAAARAPMVEVIALRPLLSDLRAMGLRLGVATNDSEHAAKAQLAEAGILNCFDSVQGFDSGHGAKPGPGMCAAFADHFGLIAGDVAMIGDSLHDLHAGRAAGMLAIGVLSGMAGHDMLAPHADLVLPDISDLPAQLALGGALQAAHANSKATQTGSQSVAI